MRSGIYKYLFLLLITIAGLKSNSQSVEASFHSLAGTGNKLPFWLWTNQLGRYNQNNNIIQNFEFVANHQLSIGKSAFTLEGQTRLNFILADKSNVRFTELYGGVNWKFLQIKAGAFAEKEVYRGLSASNGNLANSRNARPHPSVRLGFNRYLSLTNWFSAYGFWEEGILDDERITKNTHLHHKAFYGRLGNPKSIQITAGIEHFVMWAGTHPRYGELQGWEEYFSYIKGSAGGPNALVTDQMNVMGNGYGTYQFEAHKSWNSFAARFYLSHPFDDKSGMEMINWRDNLYGLFFSFNKEKPLLKAVLIEYYYTKHQSGSYHLKLQADGTRHGTGMDDYYNHGVYNSGATYHQMAMVSPLFAPVNITDGISYGFDNTRFSGLHMGINGFLKPSLEWKGMATYTNNFGQYKSEGETSYNPSRKQLATLLQLVWQLQKMPISFGASLAGDYGSLFDEGNTNTRIGGIGIC